MNRREALKTMAGSFAGALAAFILPAPRRHIDLAAFCARSEHPRWDFRLPFTLTDWTYATDGVQCVRVDPLAADKVDHEGRPPAFASLPWDHDRLRGWRTLPQLSPVMLSDSDCMACDGRGFMGGAMMIECEACDGFGQRHYTSKKTGRKVLRECRTCKGECVVPPPGVPVCPACKGEAYGCFPGAVILDGRFFERRRYESLQKLGAEYVVTKYAEGDSLGNARVLKVRFQGGDGMLLEIDQNAAMHRMRAAKVRQQHTEGR